MDVSTNYQTYLYNLSNASGQASDNDPDFDRLANQAEEAMVAYNNDVQNGESTAISGPTLIAALQKLAAHWGMSKGNAGTPPTDPTELAVYKLLNSTCVAGSSSTLSDVLFGDQATALSLFAQPRNADLFMPTSQGGCGIYNAIDASSNQTNDSGNVQFKYDVDNLLNELHEYQTQPLSPAAKAALAASIGLQMSAMEEDFANGTASGPAASDGFLKAISLLLNTL